jgi:hypothetical protein
MLVGIFIDLIQIFKNVALIFILSFEKSTFDLSLRGKHFVLAMVTMCCLICLILNVKMYLCMYCVTASV